MNCGFAEMTLQCFPSFTLKLMACKKKAALAQLDRNATRCEASEGLEVRFDAEQMQAEYERKLTPSARAAITESIG